MKNTIYKTTFALAAVVLSLTSCVKDELYDTPHPDHGKVTLTTDWSARGEGIAVPERWTMNIGDYTGEETAATHAPDHLFTPGSYTLSAYNQPEGIALSGTTATVAADTEHEGCIDSQPGWLFTSVQNITIEKDCDHAFTAPMRQQVRRLTLVIDPTGDTKERITAITATLGGAAGTLDFATQTHGTPSDIPLTFTKITEGEDAGKWTATVRLLGIAGEQQKLTGTLTFADGNPQPVSLESDLTTSLAEFNNGKTEPLTLDGTVAETPTEAGVTTTIDDWDEVKGDPVEAM